MTLGQVDAYVIRLERELRKRGIEDTRIIEEAREHLVDAVEDGRQRGLSVADAEREAFERFAVRVRHSHRVTARARGIRAQGQHLGTIPPPRPPQNVAFAGPDKKTLYIVGRGVVSKVQMLTDGFKDRAK